MDKLLNLIERLIEALNILKIIAAPFLIGLVLACIFYLYKPDMIGQSISIIMTLTGLILGILLVRRVRKSTTATEFNARIHASPDLNNLDKEKK